MVKGLGGRDGESVRSGHARIFEASRFVFVALQDHVRQARWTCRYRFLVISLTLGQGCAPSLDITYSPSISLHRTQCPYTRIALALYIRMPRTLPFLSSLSDPGVRWARGDRLVPVPPSHSAPAPFLSYLSSFLPCLSQIDSRSLPHSIQPHVPIFSSSHSHRIVPAPCSRILSSLCIFPSSGSGPAPGVARVLVLFVLPS